MCREPEASMDDHSPKTDDEERLRQLVLARFGGRIREFAVRARVCGLVLAGKCGSFHVKQMVQETVAAATDARIVANEIEVD